MDVDLLKSLGSIPAKSLCSVKFKKFTDDQGAFTENVGVKY